MASNAIPVPTIAPLNSNALPALLPNSLPNPLLSPLEVASFSNFLLNHTKDLKKPLNTLKTILTTNLIALPPNSFLNAKNPVPNAIKNNPPFRISFQKGISVNLAIKSRVVITIPVVTLNRNLPTPMIPSIIFCNFSRFSSLLIHFISGTRTNNLNIPPSRSRILPAPFATSAAIPPRTIPPNGSLFFFCTPGLSLLSLSFSIFFCLRKFCADIFLNFSNSEAIALTEVPKLLRPSTTLSLPTETIPG